MFLSETKAWTSLEACTLPFRNFTQSDSPMGLCPSPQQQEDRLMAKERICTCPPVHLPLLFFSTAFSSGLVTYTLSFLPLPLRLFNSFPRAGSLYTTLQNDSKILYSPAHFAGCLLYRSACTLELCRIHTKSNWISFRYTNKFPHLRSLILNSFIALSRTHASVRTKGL